MFLFVTGRLFCLFRLAVLNWLLLVLILIWIERPILTILFTTFFLFTLLDLIHSSITIPKQLRLHHRFPRIFHLMPESYCSAWKIIHIAFKLIFEILFSQRELIEYIRFCFFINSIGLGNILTEMSQRIIFLFVINLNRTFLALSGF